VCDVRSRRISNACIINTTIPTTKKFFNTMILDGIGCIDGFDIREERQCFLHSGKIKVEREVEPKVAPVQTELEVSGQITLILSAFSFQKRCFTFNYYWYYIYMASHRVPKTLHSRVPAIDRCRSDTAAGRPVRTFLGTLSSIPQLASLISPSLFWKVCDACSPL
jgi:hypothetical protein